MLLPTSVNTAANKYILKFHFEEDTSLNVVVFVEIKIWTFCFFKQLS